MKKSLLALLIASALPLAATAEVVVYGKGNIALQNADEDGETNLELVSNASRIGLKGSEQINDGLKAIYQFEYQTEVDDGNGSNGTFSQRNIYIGLQGSGGTVIGGKFDTPTKTAQEKIDLFNDLEGDINDIVSAETRPGNIVQYTTPASWGEFAVNVARVAAEDSDLDDGTSASFTYTTPSLYLAIAGEQDVSEQDVDIVRLVGRYTFGAVQLGALYEMLSGDFYDEDLDSDIDVDVDAFIVSAKFNATESFALKAQYGDAAADQRVLSFEESFDADGTQLSVGFDYSLSKNTTLFGYYTQEDFEFDSTEVQDDKWLGVGMDMKF